MLFSHIKIMKHTPKAPLCRGPRIITCTVWQLHENVILQRPWRPRRTYVAGMALWHSPVSNFSKYVA
jgi:hypothetical protein